MRRVGPRFRRRSEVDPMSGSPTMTIERLREFDEAWGRGDIDALMEFVTDDCEYHARSENQDTHFSRGENQRKSGHPFLSSGGCLGFFCLLLQ